MIPVKPAAGRKVSRLALPLFALCVLASLSVLYLAARPFYMTLLTVAIQHPFATPFFDLEYLFATVSCWQHGVDVYIANPCDQRDRPMGYSPLWLRLGFLAIGNSWSAPWGLCLSVLFCFSLALLPPTRTLRDQAVIGLAAISSLSLFAVERGNVDVMIYLVSIGAACLFVQSRWLRLGGYMLVFGAGLLKFYPFAALVAISQERLRWCIGLALGAVAAMVLFVWSFHDELHRMAHNIPHDSVYGDLIGAIQLPAGLATSLRPMLVPLIGPALAQSVGASPVLAIAGVIVPVCAAIWIVVRIVSSAGIARAMPVLAGRPRAMFGIGAALVTGCFFTGQSVGYRGVLLLLVIPGLLVLAYCETPGRVQRLARLTLFALLTVMFRLVPLGVFTRNGAYPGNSVTASACWLGFEILWWWVASVLLGLLLCLLRESPAGREAWLLLRRWRSPCRTGIDVSGD